MTVESQYQHLLNKHRCSAVTKVAEIPQVCIVEREGNMLCDMIQYVFVRKTSDEVGHAGGRISILRTRDVGMAECCCASRTRDLVIPDLRVLGKGSVLLWVMRGW
jgi:hypothetical protein